MTPLKWHHTDTETIISTQSTGFITAAYTTKMEALELPASIICRDPTHYCGKCIFVGVDCQSCLTVMNPLERPKYGTVDCSYMLHKFHTMACNYNQLIHLQWVPLHIGLQSNEEVDQTTNLYCDLLSSNMEHHKSIQPVTLKTILKQDTTQSFMNVSLVIPIILVLTFKFVESQNPTFVPENLFHKYYKPYTHDGILAKLKVVVLTCIN